ncbi:MAG: YceI family protein [Bdellovibrionales bacterium]|nr:YceI family protein [Massilia sp.]
MKLFRYCFFALVLVACTAAPPPAPVSPPAGDAAAAWYQKAAQAGKKVYRIDPSQSLITVTVRSGGALARFGHDHVVPSRGIEGFVAPDAGRADFHFRLDQMTVDEAALRTGAGLDTQPSADAIEGTRANMLTRVLEAERFPVVMLHAQRQPGAEVVRLTITLHGVTRTLEVPVLIERSAASLAASGALTLKQTDFGVTPMSVMGGAMTVQDQMELKFKIVAAPLR